MKTSTLRLVACAALLSLSACKEKEEAQELPPPPPAAPKAFVPPADGRVEASTLAKWRQADSLIRKIDSIYFDSIQGNPDRMDYFTAQQNQAREIAARKAGLLGWDEYYWVIDVASANPANAEAFGAAGLQSSAPKSSDTGKKPSSK